MHLVQEEGSSSGNDDELEGHYLLESEESIRPIDSIARNADFLLTCINFYIFPILFLLLLCCWSLKRYTCFHDILQGRRTDY